MNSLSFNAPPANLFDVLSWQFPYIVCGENIEQTFKIN